jgi:hypothetical protein
VLSRAELKFLEEEEKKKIIDVFKIAVGFAVGIIFILLIQFFLQDTIRKLGDPIVASILAISGIVATIAVGIVIFLMQKRADKKINQIITGETKQRTSRKSHFCNKILHNLNQIKSILQNLKAMILEFPNNMSNIEFLNRSRLYVLLEDFGIKYRWLPEILEANEILVEYFNDTTLYEELKTIEAFGGPSAVMQEEYVKGNIFGGLDSSPSREGKIAAIDANLGQIENLLQRIQREIAR